MPVRIHLYIAGLHPRSLRAVKRLRALVDAEWLGRCEWRVLEAAEGSAALAGRALPALCALHPSGRSWLAADPSEGIPSSWLAQVEAVGPEFDAGERGGPLVDLAATEPERGHRPALDLAPMACGIFLCRSWLVYANPAFHRRFGLDDAQCLGRSPAEWQPARSVAAVERALAPSRPGRRAIVSHALPSEPDLPLTALYAAPPSPARPAGEEARQALREHLEQIRATNHSIGNALVGVLGYAELLVNEIAASHPAAAERVRAISAAAQRLDLLSQEISNGIRAALDALDDPAA